MLGQSNLSQRNQIDPNIAKIAADQIDGFNKKAPQKDEFRDFKTNLPEGVKTSVALADQKIKSKDLLTHFSEKIATKGLALNAETINNNIIEKLDSFLNKNAFENIKDTAAFSASIVEKNQNQKTKENKSESFWSEVITDKPQKGEKGQQAPTTSLPLTPHSPQEIMAQLKNTGKELLQKYLMAYSESLVTQSPQKKQEAHQLKEKLLGLNFPKEKLSDAEKNVTQMITKDIKQQAKEAMMKYMLTHTIKETKSEAFTHGNQLTQILKSAKDLGLIKDLKSGTNEVLKEQKFELNAFVTDHLDQATMKHQIQGTIPELIKEFEKVNRLSQSADFDGQTYFKTFQQKLDHLGLKPFFAPTHATIKVTDTEAHQKKIKNDDKLKNWFSTFTKSKIEKKEEKKDEQEKKDQTKKEEDQAQEELTAALFNESDSIEDQLRSVLMQLLIKQDLRSQIRLKLHLRKLKKVSKITEKDFKKLEIQAQKIAIYKLVELTRESFEERAVLPQLKGPAYELSRQKLKTALVALQKLDAKPDKKELKQMQDQVNKSIFSIVKDDYIKVELYLESSPKSASAAQAKRNELLGILERLKSESNIQEKIRPSAFRDITLKSDTQIADMA